MASHSRCELESAPRLAVQYSRRAAIGLSIREETQQFVGILLADTDAVENQRIISMQEHAVVTELRRGVTSCSRFSIGARVGRAVQAALAIVGIVACLGGLAACGSNEQQAVIDAVTAYLVANGAPEQSKVEVQKIDGDYARVEVIPPPDTTDPALAFLKRENGRWTVLALGTGFPPEDLDKLGIPASIRPS